MKLILVLSIILIVIAVGFYVYYGRNLSLYNIVVFKSRNSYNLFDFSKSHMVFRIKPKFRTKLQYNYIFADPFLFVYNDELYLFYEEKSRLQNGIIKAFKTKDLIKWIDLGIILEENFHLSFPYVFEIDGEILMIPETATQDSIRLYKFENFPYFCVFQHKLLSGSKFVDSHIYEKNRIKYLFTNETNNELELYYSTDMINWAPHPQSPIVTGNDKSRSGGSLVELDDLLLRIAQDTSSYYGKNFHVFDVKQISLEDYHEVDYKRNVIKNDMDWNKRGGHHFNLVMFQNQYIYACDGKIVPPLIDAVLFPGFRIAERIYKRFFYRKNK